MKRTIEIETGTHESLWFPPTHESRKEEGATAESLCGVRVEASRPRPRDWWAVLRGRYVPTLVVREVLTAAAVDFTLRHVWSQDRLESALYANRSFLDDAEEQ